MSDARAIIIAAFISAVTAVGGMLASIVSNQRSNERQRKNDSDERFFYEMYQRRLALYEEITKILAAMGKPKDEIIKMSPGRFYDKVLNDYYTLITLINRLRMYGSPGTRKILLMAKTHLEVILQNDLKIAKGQISEIAVINIVTEAAAFIAFDGAVIRDFLIFINDLFRSFTECVEKETMGDFVDKRIDEILKSFACKKDKKALHRKDKTPIDNQYEWLSDKQNISEKDQSNDVGA